MKTEQEAFEAWCPYTGSPDPRVVWAAAWKAAHTLLSQTETTSRDLLAQAAALAVVAVREEKYYGAYVIADEVLKPSDDTKAHLERLQDFRRFAEVFKVG